MFCNKPLIFGGGTSVAARINLLLISNKQICIQVLLRRSFFFLFDYIYLDLPFVHLTFEDCHLKLRTMGVLAHSLSGG